MSRWFRMYEDIVNDPKVMRLAPAMRWQWVAVLCVASKNGGRIPLAAELCFHLRLTEQQAAAVLVELNGAGLVDKDADGFSPHNWNGRQYKSDVSNERVKRHRERHRNVTSAVTETPPETETETETEQSRGRARARDAAGELSREIEEKHTLADPRRVACWLAKGYTQTLILETIAAVMSRGGPPITSLAYFDPILAKAHSSKPLTLAERSAAIDIDAALKFWARTGTWWRGAGPEPGQAGCRATTEHLAAHGIAPDGTKLKKVG